MTAATSESESWDELDQATRDELDDRYMKELANWCDVGLGEEGVQAYLAYRRERPYAAITTFEEGHIRKLLHQYRDPSKEPDPVDQETHRGKLEKFGAERLHQTNIETYWMVLSLVGFAALVALLIWLL